MRIGFLGAGNMASAILRGLRICEKGCYDVNPAAVRRAEAELDTRGFASGEDLCAWADIVVLAVKPQVLEGAVRPLCEALRGKAVLSIAAGWSLQRLAALLPQSRLCRVMPNTPAMVGEGMAAIAKESTLTRAEMDCVQEMFSAVGKAVVVEERLFDAVTAVSGSGPAYVYMVIEAMADAGVREGLSRDSALLLAAQTVLGSARMVLESGSHPAALRDMVCSPGGTTIDAVCVLEEKGLRAALEAAVRACADKSRAMGAESAKSR